MSTSSSSSSRQCVRRTFYGVPTKCWCGQALDTWVSETKENPYRRFYRCKIARQKPTETHLFKWVDEALHDEIKIVDAKRMDIHQDLQALRQFTQVQLDSLRNWVLSREEVMRNEMKENMYQVKREIEDATTRLKQQLDEDLNNHLNSKLNNNGRMNKIAAAVVICGALSYMYWKLY